MSNKEHDQCRFCHRVPWFSKYSPYFFYEERNEEIVAENGFGAVCIGCDPNGETVIRGFCYDREEHTEDYYPKYCPECGRMLKGESNGQDQALDK